MVMGDMTLAEDEVNPVMSGALENGLEVTALHNHFFFHRPRVMFMHVGGHADIERMATAVRKAIDRVAEIRAANAKPAVGLAARRRPSSRPWEQYLKSPTAWSK
jgi:hypothetical protein